MISLAGSRYRVKYDDNEGYQVYMFNGKANENVTESMNAEMKEELIDDLVYALCKLVEEKKTENK